VGSRRASRYLGLRARPLRGAVLLAVLLAALSGCGGGGTDSARAYAAGGDAACRASEAAIRQLPALQKSERLDIAQLEARATRINQRFLAGLRALKPPSQLRAAHQRLLADSASAASVNTRAAFIAHYRRLQADYTAVGMRGCASQVRAALSQYLTGHA
jgi:hypothetical protein